MTSTYSATVSFSFTDFTLSGLFFAVLDATVFGVLTDLDDTGLLSTTLDDGFLGAILAAFTVFTGLIVLTGLTDLTTLTALGFAAAFVGGALAFAAFGVDAEGFALATAALGATLFAKFFFSTFFVTVTGFFTTFLTAGFVADVVLVLEVFTGADFIGFFFTTGFVAVAMTLLFDFSATFTFGLADDVADFAGAFDLEVSFLAIYLLDQNFVATSYYTRFSPYCL